MSCGSGSRPSTAKTSRQRFALYHPDIEVIEPPEVIKLGLDPLSRGRAGRIRVQRRWHAEWGELRFEPDEILDLVTACW